MDGSLSGVINLNKPKGITSHDAVTKVKRALKVKKAGHAGTLDPMATGVLLVCLNDATKIVRFLVDLGKQYTATLKLGQRTDTFDADGKVIEEKDARGVTEGQVRAVFEKFTGVIAQVPPMYSAVKHAGKPLYELARAGIVVERQSREVTVSQLELTAFRPPLLDIRVSCSKGTYIRTLAEDIGAALGVGAHVAEIQRTATGGFDVRDAMDLQELREVGDKAVLPVDSALGHLREVVLGGREYTQAKRGGAFKCTVPLPEGPPGRPLYLRLKSPGGALFAIGVIAPDEPPTAKPFCPIIKIERLLRP